MDICFAIYHLSLLKSSASYVTMVIVFGPWDLGVILITSLMLLVYLLSGLQSTCVSIVLLFQLFLFVSMEGKKEYIIRIFGISKHFQINLLTGLSSYRMKFAFQINAWRVYSFRSPWKAFTTQNFLEKQTEPANGESKTKGFN